MEITIHETIPIIPSQTPHNDSHTLPLSHLDTDPNLNLTFRYFRVYAARPDHHPFHVITTALSAALGPYYPLTSILRHNPHDNRLELSWTKGRGLPLIRATADFTFESVAYLENPDPVFPEKLVPHPGPEEAMTHPMILQITMFKCGGYVLGSAVHNAVCDGLGATQFFNVVAELARGLTRVPGEPVWDRASLLGPRDPPRVEFPFHELLSLDKEVDVNLSPVEPVIRECFDMKEEWLNRFKSYLFDRSGSRFTTFEALGAFIWRARVKASNVPNEEKVKFAYLMNIRKLMDPPLPKGYWGNGCAQMYVQLTAKQLLEQPIWDTAELIKKSKYNASDEYVRSYIDFLKLNRDNGLTAWAGREVTGFTDWRHLGHSGVDFGSGGPVTVFPVTKYFLGSFEHCFFLPYSCVSEGVKPDGFRVLVNLRSSAVDGFKVEMERFSRLEFDFC